VSSGGSRAGAVVAVMAVGDGEVFTVKDRDMKALPIFLK
jgi:hypothetical protein